MGFEIFVVCVFVCGCVFAFVYLCFFCLLVFACFGFVRVSKGVVFCGNSF